MKNQSSEEFDPITLLTKKYSIRQYIQIFLLIVGTFLGGVNISKQDDATYEIKLLQLYIKDVNKGLDDTNKRIDKLESTSEKLEVKHDAAHEKLSAKIDAINTKYYSIIN